MAKSKNARDLSAATATVPASPLAVRPATELLAAPVPETAINIALNNEDLVAIVVTDAETRLEGALRAELAAHQRHQVAAEALEKEVNQAVAVVPIPEIEALANALIAQGAPLGVELTVKYDRGAVDARRQIPVTTSFQVKGPYMGSFGGMRAVPLPAELVQKLDAAAEHRKQAATHGRTAQDLRNRLADIPRLTRRAQAKLAQFSLTKSTEGTALLEYLQKDLDQALAGVLPSARELTAEAAADLVVG